jgi:hypothetical protein
LAQLFSIGDDERPGQSQRLQRHAFSTRYKNNLTGTNWTDLTADILATNSPVTVTDAFSPTPRFYRLRVSQ